MKLNTRIAAGILLGVGLPISFLTLPTLLSRQASPQSQQAAGVTFLMMGVPPTTLGIWLLRRGDRRQKKQHDRLQGTFFRLLKEGNGHITPLLFAMETNLNGEAAKAYLDDRAKEFSANFHVNEAGTVSYYFDLGSPSVSRLAPSEETYDVILEYVPSNKRRQVVKTLRELMGLEWHEAKALLKSNAYPITVQQGIDKATAEKFRSRLDAVGVEVLIVLN
jgi:ribosomal protein L7/L12